MLVAFRKYLGVVAELGKVRIAAFVTFTNLSAFQVALGRSRDSEHNNCNNDKDDDGGGAGYEDGWRCWASCCGVFLTSMSAAHLNQLFEVKFDSKMLRTHSRPLVKGLCSKQFALCSSLCLGIAGTTILSKYVNLLSAQLAFSNIFIYSFLYTPLKRLSIFNTDVGALVGAIVPLIGWSSASCIPNISSDLLDGKCLILPLILFSWQFLHFYPLSHLIGQDYLRAGYKMAILQRPLFCRISCFAHSCLIAAICHLSASKFDFVTPKCALYCLAPINILAIGLSSKYLLNGCIGNARILFRFSLVHLPYILSVYLLKNCPYLHKSLTDTESYFKKAFGII